ncbi:hypothetical protein BGX27_001177 [Mortierella sp. AM989]|nr:hypothetical protein BGX27_001177 [Mortierella sp. AM989]
MDFDLDGDVETQPSFEIHYIQLESNNGLCADSNDHVIYGEGKPDQVVRIKMDTESSVPSINICACAVSVTGSYALTFHQVGKYGSLNIWDLKPNSASKETFNRPQTLNVPCAQATVYLKGINFAVQENMSVNSDISPTGSYAVVAFSGISNVEEELEENPEKKLENRFQAFKWIPKVVAFSGISSVEKKLEEKPEKELEEKPKKKFKNHFQAFKWIRKAPIDQDQDEPWPLKRIETVCDGGGYALSGFCNYKRSEEDKEEERFCTTDGRSFSVHSVQDNWELLYKLEMQPERNTISARTPFASIQGRYFAWSHTTSAISIWDIDTGKLISHIYTDGNQMAKFPVLSRDGSMIAVPVNRKIRIYETSTGIELGVYRKGLPTDDYDNYILFGQGRFMTRNILESTVKENQKYDARSVVRVQDMSIVNSTRIHEDYKMCFRRNGKNPVFSYGCGSVLNILQPGDLLATEVPEEGCGKIEIVSGDACEHSFSLQFKRRIKENKGGDKIETLTVPLPAQDIISIKEAVGLTNGISSLVGDFAGGDKTYKEEVIQYLKSRLCPTLEHQESSLIPLCKAWTVESKSDMEFIIHNLLPADRITWIPDASSAKDSKGPLSIILEFAKTQPSAIYTAKLIMDYCVKNAIRSRNLPFLNPFFRSLYQVMDLVPQEGILQLGRITHISVMNRSHIMDNHIIIHPPKWQFWKQNSTPLYKIKDPIMQLHISGSKPDPANDLFTQPVFMASFDALWSYEPKKGSFMSTKEETRTTWWKILYHLIRLNCRPQIYNFVECYDFNLEFHENPAIAALVAYKW